MLLCWMSPMRLCVKIFLGLFAGKDILFDLPCLVVAQSLSACNVVNQPPPAHIIAIIWWLLYMHLTSCTLLNKTHPCPQLKNQGLLLCHWPLVTLLWHHFLILSTMRSKCFWLLQWSVMTTHLAKLSHLR